MKYRLIREFVLTDDRPLYSIQESTDGQLWTHVSSTCTFNEKEAHAMLARCANVRAPLTVIAELES